MLCIHEPQKSSLQVENEEHSNNRLIKIFFIFLRNKLLFETLLMKYPAFSQSLKMGRKSGIIVCRALGYDKPRGQRLLSRTGALGCTERWVNAPNQSLMTFYKIILLKSTAAGCHGGRT